MNSVFQKKYTKQSHLNMKKMLTYIILTLLSLGIIYFVGVIYIASRMKLDFTGMINDFRESYRQKSFFLNDIDLDDGTYALYVNHKEFGEFMVLNADAIKENKDSLKVSLSFANYFPGEGRDFSYGVTLFNDNSAVKSKEGKIFKNFEIGTLAVYAIPVKKHSIQGYRKLILEKFAALQNNEAIFYTPPNFHFPIHRDYSFYIDFPSITLPVTRNKDSWGGNRIASINGIEHREWLFGQEEGSKAFFVQKLENCIREKAASIPDFEVIVGVNEETNNYLVQTVSGEEYALATTEDDYKFMRVENYHNFHFIVHFRASKEDAEKLYALDFSDCFSEENNNKQKLIDVMKALVKQSAQPHLDVEKGEVELYGFKNTFTKSNEIKEQLYELWWLELEN